MNRKDLLPMQYATELIEKAKQLGIENATNYPKAKEGFWFENIWIVSIFLDKTGRESLTFEESCRYYGRDNIRKYMDSIAAFA